MDLAGCYYLDDRGQAHNPITGGGLSAEAMAGRTRILRPGLARALGIPVDTPADDPRAAPHDVHRVAPARPPAPRDDPAERPPVAPPEPDRPPRRIRHEPRQSWPDLRALPPPVDLLEEEPANDPLEAPDAEEGDGSPAPEAVETGPEPGQGGGAAHPDCPSCEATFVCAGCGNRWVPVSEEEAAQVAAVALSGVGRAIVMSSLARKEGIRSVSDLPEIHAPVSAEVAEAGGRIIRPWLMRAGGAAPILRAIGNMGTLAVLATATAMGAHAKGRCHDCRDEAAA